MTNCFYCYDSSYYTTNSDLKCPEIVCSCEENAKEIAFFQPTTFEVDTANRETILKLVESDPFIRTNYKPINLNTHFIIFQRNKNYKTVERFWCKACFEQFIDKQMRQDREKTIQKPTYKISANPKVFDMKLVDDFVDCIDCRIEIHGICYSCDETPKQYMCRDCLYKARDKFGIKFVKATPIGYQLPSCGGCCTER